MIRSRELRFEKQISYIYDALSEKHGPIYRSKKLGLELLIEVADGTYVPPTFKDSAADEQEFNDLNLLEDLQLVAKDSENKYQLTPLGHLIHSQIASLNDLLIKQEIEDLKELRKNKSKRKPTNKVVILTTSLAALLTTYTLTPTPAQADIGEAIRSPVGGQMQVIAGQRIAEQGTSSAVSITGKVKDEIMYGGFTFTYNSALPAPSLNIETGPHVHPEKWHLLPLADVTIPLSGATPTLGAGFYATAKPDEKFSLDLSGRYSYNTATNTHALEGKITPATALGKGWVLGEETSVQYDVHGSLKVTTGPVLRYTTGASHVTFVPAYQITKTPDGVQHAFVYTIRGRLGIIRGS